MAAVPLVHIYSDGSCSPNPGPGGWGVVLLSPDRRHRKELSGAEPQTTNNRMELRAALEGLRALRRPCRVVVHTDSQYLRNAFESRWLDRWQRNGWKTSGGRPVQNADLWRQLLEAARPHRVRWVWVRGHGDDEENNRADALANEARKRLLERAGS